MWPHHTLGLMVRSDPKDRVSNHGCEDNPFTGS
jgi:hypothetical protein